MAKRVFLSYCWHPPEDKEWARALAARLRKDGVDVVLDQWETLPGDRLPLFMEAAIRDCTFVIVVCTPTYKARADSRKGGVGYEGDIIAGDLFTGGGPGKYVPVLRRGSWAQSVPTALSGVRGCDLSDGPDSSKEYRELLSVLHRRRPVVPALGPSPEWNEEEIVRALSESTTNLDDLFARVKQMRSTGENDSWNLLLRIIHIGGLRMTSVAGSAPRVRMLMRRLLRSASTRRALLPTGHDPFAAREFERFLTAFFARQGARDCENWLVDTGSRTQLGDEASLAVGDALFRRLSDFFDKAVSMQGPRDLWGGEVPFLSPVSQLTAHSQRLGDKWFPPTPLPLRLPAKQARQPAIELYRLDTATFSDRMALLLDRPTLGQSKLDEFETFVGQHSTDGPLFRIVAMHHPVHSLRHKQLRDANDVAGVFAKGAPGASGPLIRLMLTSADGEVFPAFGSLPPNSEACRHVPLGRYQAQLSLGSPTEIPLDGRPHTQSFQILHFYWRSSTPKELLIERLVATRAGNIGPFLFMADADHGEVAERMTFQI